jgi:hypothetical protein
MHLTEVDAILIAVFIVLWFAAFCIAMIGMGGD